MSDLHSLFEIVFDWATDPEGMGLPIVIGVGLGMILYFMHATEKGQHASDTKIEEHKEYQRKYTFPDKPF
ncbi:MAG: hypothetical protein HZC01_00380 [Candidatus Kerfeldbacteria bacterium]|nr:hypothetical protein [Candidatus Kerfeldbacteria bacterium]